MSVWKYALMWKPAVRWLVNRSGKMEIGSEYIASEEINSLARLASSF